MKEFNSKYFVPDSTYRVLFPWHEVLPQLENLYKERFLYNFSSCPRCGTLDLIKIDYRDTPESFKKLAGIGGILTICPNCKIQVEFIQTMIS